MNADSCYIAINVIHLIKQTYCNRIIYIRHYLTAKKGFPCKQITDVSKDCEINQNTRLASNKNLGQQLRLSLSLRSTVFYFDLDITILLQRDLGALSNGLGIYIYEYDLLGASLHYKTLDIIPHHLGRESHEIDSMQKV